MYTPNDHQLPMDELRKMVGARRAGGLFEGPGPGTAPCFGVGRPAMQPRACRSRRRPSTFPPPPPPAPRAARSRRRTPRSWAATRRPSGTAAAASSRRTCCCLRTSSASATTCPRRCRWARRAGQDAVGAAAAPSRGAHPHQPACPPGTRSSAPSPALGPPPLHPPKGGPQVCAPEVPPAAGGDGQDRVPAAQQPRLGLDGARGGPPRGLPCRQPFAPRRRPRTDHRPNPLLTLPPPPPPPPPDPRHRVG
jgi:hypothetical protein